MVGLSNHIVSVMVNIKRAGAKWIAIVACFVALSSSLRFFKHVGTGPIQFVNFPAIFTIMGGLMFGHKAGALIGTLSFAASDLLIGSVGPWTVYCSLSMGLVGAASPFMRRMEGGSSPNLLGLGVGSYLLVLAYDVLSSIMFWALMVPIPMVLILTLTGLFLPSPRTFYPVGLVTEMVTVALIMLIYPPLRKAWKEVRP